MLIIHALQARFKSDDFLFVFVLAEGSSTYYLFFLWFNLAKRDKQYGSLRQEMVHNKSE